ncbi:MAG: MMPL family transporter [Gordonia sp. (in: high G+C Gram-positive bacteria)]
MSTDLLPAPPDAPLERPAEASAPSLLERWARTVIRFRKPVLFAWLIVLAFGGTCFFIVEKQLGLPDYVIYGSESERADHLLHDKFPSFGKEQDAVVITSPRGNVAHDATLRRLVGRIGEEVGRDYAVASVIGPYSPVSTGQISHDGTTVLLIVSLKQSAQERSAAALRLQSVVDSHLDGTDYQGFLTGQSPLSNALTEVETHDQQTAELIGIPIAFLVLLLVLRSFIAALLPLLTAIGGVLLSSIGILGLAEVMNLDKFAIVLATVLGLGLGIDYALFVVARTQEELRNGQTVDDAVVIALRTSGRTVLTAGFIVMIALGSLLLIRGHLFIELPVVSTVVVISSMITSLTLLPALLATLGHRIAGRPPRRVREPGDGLWARVTRAVLRSPVSTCLPALLLLLLLAAPLGGIKLGLDLGLSALSQTAPGQGQQLITEKFGAGAVAPVAIIACADETLDSDRAVADLGAAVDRIGRDPRVGQVASIVQILDATGQRTAAHLRETLAMPGVGSAASSLIDAQHRCAFVSASPKDAVDSVATLGLIDDLRKLDVPHTTLTVGGMTAQYRDLAAETAAKLPWVVLTVVGLSFLYLVVAFRSLVLPLKSTLLNVVATAASVGATVAVFQFGWGEDVLGFTSSGTLQAFLPVALFAILFGLSMDYEVLIVGRIREEYLATPDLMQAVPRAMEASARQVTAAAAIMAAVFGSLMVGEVLELKQLGFGLALAVLIDATLVRMILVPGAMVLMGAGNWWLPAWLDRIIPEQRAHH